MSGALRGGTGSTVLGEQLIGFLQMSSKSEATVDLTRSSTHTVRGWRYLQSFDFSEGGLAWANELLGNKRCFDRW
jgi:hypothetical protein